MTGRPTTGRLTTGRLAAGRLVPRRTAATALATLVAGTALALLPAQAAQAHPLGNFTVSQYDGLVVAPDTLRVDHVEDLAEIPAAQERNRIDTDGNEELDAAELAAWATARCATAASGARLTVGEGGGEAVPVTAGGAQARERPGQAGLRTLRVTCELTAPLPGDEPQRITYHPAGVATGAGWREITARGDRMTLTEAGDLPRDSLSRRLTSYPGDLLSSPPDHRSAAFTVRAGGPALAGGEDEKSGSPVAGVLPRGADRWAQALTGLVARHELTVGFAAFALGVSLLLGAMHALAPGHGKTMMAAAATAGGRSSLRDVLALGFSVTMTHTLGVFALGALIVAGSAAAPTVVFWLSLASGALVAIAGALLLRRAWRHRRRPQGHTHGHTHGPTHAHEPHEVPDEARVPVLTSAHRHEHEHGHDVSHGPVATLTAERADPGHAHHHGHHHDAHDHSHDHDHAHAHAHAHADALAHARSHLPPAPGLRGIILLGFAGGLVPSPSAVVVLVGAAALGQAWFGFLLVIAYGAGLAVTLAGAGFAVVRLRETTTRRLAARPRGRFLALAHRTAPFASAVVVLALGCGLMLRGVVTGLG
ncbi:nickel transporter [Streptomyces sp. JV176]|uniref:HoxN/HupN/NixA family nickel/cobalt transporter n=1 Tax=Streptomyces sp. JV176 TaxID=858630 RepID=UPI002E792C52|nr:sulfite exporter TauE/SafE family protein [Streptomyces sp. JV176]MEE1801165.1 nickel transporter [Streptomyces sp. JV176]